MKIKYHFKDLTLGELSKDKNYFYYNSDIAGEKAFQKFASSGLYTLTNSANIKSSVLFDEFESVLKNVRARWDLVSSAKITDTDDDFTALCKYAQLQQATDKFWFEVLE